MGKVINLNNMDSTFDAMVEEQAKQCRKEQDNMDTMDKKKDAVKILSKFKNYISGARFNMKCMFEAKKTGMDYKIVKSLFIKKFLGKIADVLGLVIDITGEVILYAVKFISSLINSIVNLATTVIKKIISLFTLNCGDVCHA